MKPSLRTHKKRHGTFMYPGAAGFKFNFGKYAPNEFAPRAAAGFLIAATMFMAIVAFNAAIAVIFASMTFLFYMTFSSPVGLFGTGAPPTPAELEEKAALAKIETLTKGLIEQETKSKFAIIDELRKELTELKGTELKEAVIKLEKELKALSEKGTEKVVSKTFVTALQNALEEKKSEIDEIVANGGKMKGPLMLEIKAAVTMEMANTIEAVGSASHYSLTSNTGIISILRKRIMTYFQGVSIGGLSIDRPYAMWIEELDEQGSPIFIGEGDAKTKLSVRYEEREKKARKIAVYGKVTTEMLKYLPQLISHIQNNLVRRMDIKTEDQLFNGDDTGDNLKGLIPYSTAFDGGVGTAGGPGLVGLVPAANEYDVIRAVALQVYNSYGTPSRIYILPDVLALMQVSKDSEGRYLLPPFTSADGKTIAGVELLPTNALVGTGYDFVGGDLSVVNVSFLEQSNIQIGLDGNDFTNNMKTILVEQQLVQFVSANDTQVLVKGDMATAKALLESVPVP